MKIVAVVPMKLVNRRCPNKNTRSFQNGKALCAYILDTLLSVPDIEKVYVYCSNTEIQKYIPHGVTFVQRSAELDQDSTKMNEVLRRFAEEVDADAYVMAHATAPFVRKESIEKGIEALKKGYDSSFTVKKIQDFMWENGKPLNYELDAIPRTQDLPPILVETSGFYIYKKEIIEKYNRRIGNAPFLVEVDEIESIDIDEEIDFSIAEAVYNHILRGKQDGETEIT